MAHIVHIEAFLNAQTCTTNATSDATTWREWIRDVLINFQYEAEGFDGKRPFGNSGWESELAEGLAIVDPDIGSFITDHGDTYFEVDDWNRVGVAWKAVLDHVLFPKAALA